MNLIQYLSFVIYSHFVNSCLFDVWFRVHCVFASDFFRLIRTSARKELSCISIPIFVPAVLVNLSHFR